MELDPTIIRTRTCSGLLRLLSACKKYLITLQDLDTREVDNLLYEIRRAEKVHKEEISRVGYRKYKED